MGNTLDRRDIILGDLQMGGLGLEIGGSYQPVAAGFPGLNVRTLDHLSTDDLIAKYRNMGVDTSRIRPVDYVWGGERYRDLVGETRFDWIVASHVVEHVPDLVGFVNQCAEILTEDGVLTLAVPDRRYTFDFFRPESCLAELVDAHLQGRTMSTPGAVADHFLHLAELNGQGTWDAEHQGLPTLLIPPEHAAEKFRKSQGGAYQDVHAWTFTPSSFRLAIEDLHVLGLLELKERSFHPSIGCEFFVQLSRTGAGSGLERQSLAEMAVQERNMGGPDREALAAEAAGLRRAIELAHTEREALRAEVSRLGEAQHALSTETARLREALDAVRSSTSWRVTAPLRALKGRGRG